MPKRLFNYFLAAVFALLSCGAVSAQYVRTDLLTNSGAGDTLLDTNLVNAWGVTALPGSPFWVSDNTTGKSTLYTGTGQQIPLMVTVPGLNGAQGTPTGIVGTIEIDGLWAIQLGQDGGPNGKHNQLFFTAGSSNYRSGTFGVITVGP